MAVPVQQLTARGVVAVVLAVGAAVSVVSLAVGAVVQSTITVQGAAILTTTLGTVIGSVATYLGGHPLLDRFNQPPKPKPEPNNDTDH